MIGKSEYLTYHSQDYQCTITTSSNEQKILRKKEV
jgi:hypothetical protein